MTFLNPFVLFGLAAAAIPILIHLFNIRKLRTIEFSSLTFLKELNKNKIRRIRIRQWLLLILRTLLILLIVLAFSRPALKGNFGTAGARAKSTLVILMDNSASMALNNERGKFLSQAQSQALEVIALMKENDEVLFLRLSDLPNATMEIPSHDTHTLETLVRETEVTYSYRTIEEGVRLASRLLHQSRNFNKELFIITDGQATTLSSGLEKIIPRENLFEPQVKVFYTQLSRRQPENTAIERTIIPPALLQVEKPFTVNVVVKNYGMTAITNHQVSIVFDGERVMQKSVSIGSGESTTLDFSVTPKRTGSLSGYAEIEDDAFEPDDHCYFSVNIPNRIKLSIISTEEKYSRYLAAALDAALTNTNSPVTYSMITPSQITTSLLLQTDMAIISGIKSFSPSQQDVLGHFLANGGNILFFPSADTVSYSYDYLKSFGLYDFHLSRSRTAFEKIDYQYPIFQGMFEKKLQKNNPEIESPQISITLNAGSETETRSIISLSNGKNFLWSHPVGRGVLFGISVPANTDWSDLPLKNIFVPLVYQSVLYLSSPLNTKIDNDYIVGEKIEFNSSQLKKGRALPPSSLLLIDTEGRKLPLQSFLRANNINVSETIYSFDHPRAAGVYSILVQHDTVLSLPVNISRQE